MTESETSTSAGPEHVNTGPGTRLREQRESRGMSIAQVASELRLTESHVQALEADHYDLLPPTPYVRGYIRSYARLLGENADSLMAAFDGRSELPAQTELVIPPQAGDRLRFPPRMALVLLAFLALGGAAAAWWFWGDPPMAVMEQPTEPVAEADRETGMVTNGDEGDAAIADEVEPEGVEPVELDTIAPAAIDTPDLAAEQPIITDPGLLAADEDPDPERIEERDAEVEALFERIPVDIDTAALQTADPEVEDAPVEQPATLDPEIVDPEGVETVDTEVAAAAADPDAGADAVDETASEAAVTGPDELVLMIDGETWVEVTDDEGRQLIYTLYADDEPLTLRGRAPFEVFLGNAPAVTLEFGGEPVDASAFIRANDTARFRVNDEGARAP